MQIGCVASLNLGCLLLGHDSSALRQDGHTTGAFARVFIEEETCADDESNHPLAEQVGYMAIASAGSARRALLGVRPNARFSSTSRPRTVGESGRVAINDVWFPVDLQGSYSNPRIFAGVVEQNGGQSAVVRIGNVRHDGEHFSFDIKLQEASCLDQNHVIEEVDWVVVDEGTYFTPSGSMWQVGSIEVAGTGFQTVYFNGKIALVSSYLTKLKCTPDKCEVDFALLSPLHLTRVNAFQQVKGSQTKIMRLFPKCNRTGMTPHLSRHGSCLVTSMASVLRSKKITTWHRRRHQSS